MTWFRCVDKSGSPTPVMPSDLECGEITISETLSSISIPYDLTKTPIGVTLFRRNQDTYLQSSTGVGQTHYKYADGTWSHTVKTISGGGTPGMSSAYGSITIDSTTGKIVLENRTGFNYRAGAYLYTIQYMET